MKSQQPGSVPTKPIIENKQSQVPSLPSQSQYASASVVGSQPVSAQFSEVDMLTKSNKSRWLKAFFGAIALVAASAGIWMAMQRQETTVTEKVTEIGTPSALVTQGKQPVEQKNYVLTEAPQSAMEQELTFNKSYFLYKKYSLTPATKQTLKTIAEQLKANPNVKIRIAGYADEIGSEAYNMKLSEQRAQSVFNFLHKNFGIERHRMSVIAFGEKRPAVKGRSEEARKWNRRVEIVQVKRLEALNVSR